MDWILLGGVFIGGALMAFLFFRANKPKETVSLQQFMEMDRQRSVLEERNRLQETEINRLRRDMQAMDARAAALEDEARRAESHARVQIGRASCRERLWPLDERACLEQR